MIPMTLDEIAPVLTSRSAGLVPPIRVSGVSIDSRTVQPGELFFAIAGERFDGHDFVPQAIEKGAAGCVVARSVAASAPDIDPGRLLQVSDVAIALGRLAAKHRRHLRADVIAVTGSNGKTTTKCMIEHVLASGMTGRGSIKSYNNHLGLPLTLLSADGSDQFLVVEIGANAPGEVAALARLAQPDIAVVTSIGLAHVGGFGGLAGVRAEKLSLFGEVRRGGLCVVPLDDLEKPLPADQAAERAYVSFGRSPEADIRVSEVDGDLSGLRFRLNGMHDVELPIAGLHNALNAAAAFAVCRRMRMEPEAIVEALRTFELPAMRLSRVDAGGITIVDDSYNANPTSMAAAVDTLAAVDSGRRVFVAGDMLELGSESHQRHADLGRQLANAGIDVVVAVGADSRAVAEAAREAPGVIAIHYGSTAEACADLPAWLKPGDTVLVKGSRVIGLDRLVRAIRAEHETKTVSPA